MFQDMGHRIRSLRESKGISLNDFAKELGVSAGWLSQFETGKKDTIDLPTLEKLQEKLVIFPLALTESSTDNLSLRFERLQHLYRKLDYSNPEAADFILSTFERGIEHFLKYGLYES
ncbi:helix-turn-helix domain-containing protein [Peribacillus kribbensis]|uniref:helix-turn-helix domain-containing protein n=1 Tax=Peribacillus kribbensis TaxID=356658 RepID=UPI0004136586|nr:helix-turn-helix transcriptional regulator [Peribacillus kribbensis]